MIKYEPGRMGLLFVVQWQGSVFPKAMVWAIPNAIFAVLLHVYCRSNVADDPDSEFPAMSMEGVNWLYAGYTSVLGFLVVFRNNQAYTRFWEGATLINQVRGEWFNAVSTLFAFCNHKGEFGERVEHFQNTLVRLTSMLYCSALQQVCSLRDDSLEIIETNGMDEDSLKFMKDSNDRCEIIVQWIQRLIVDSEDTKVIKIAPPLLTRAFQELSRGIVNLNNARKIKDIPFPFPYAQMITCMMIVHWMVTPLIASQVMESSVFCALMCFFVTFAFWCLIYIALEIDQPFGEDANDLPLREMQRDFNQSLLRLMEPLAQRVPHYEAQKPQNDEGILAKSEQLNQPEGHVPHGRPSIISMIEPQGVVSRITRWGASPNNSGSIPRPERRSIAKAESADSSDAFNNLPSNMSNTSQKTAGETPSVPLENEPKAVTRPTRDQHPSQAGGPPGSKESAVPDKEVCDRNPLEDRPIRQESARPVSRAHGDVHDVSWMELLYPDSAISEPPRAGGAAGRAVTSDRDNQRM